ncbi:hypothetical protein U9M48_044970, partial [Paspalum notatum var. saurae]
WVAILCIAGLAERGSPNRSPKQARNSTFHPSPTLLKNPFFLLSSLITGVHGGFSSYYSAAAAAATAASADGDLDIGVKSVLIGSRVFSKQRW